MIASIRIARNLALSLFACLALSIMLFNNNDARAETTVSHGQMNRQILLAREFAECSGAHYASSEIFKMMNRKDGDSLAFHEKGNGYLLASAWQLNSTEPAGGFKSAFQRAEERTTDFKSKWMKHVAAKGDQGLVQLNQMTKNCAAGLAKHKQVIMDRMQEIQNAPKK